MSIITDVDSYKFSHWQQFPPGTSSMFSYIESRGGVYDRTVWFGLQSILKKLEPISLRDFEEAAILTRAHGVPFHAEGWKKLINRPLPIRIRALPEGTVVPTHKVLATIESTDPEFFWLVGHLETQLLRVWYPTTVATVSWHVKQLIRKYLEMTSCGPIAEELPFKLHDFGARGVSSQESAAIGGAAHLVNFLGSDTFPALLWAKKHYACDLAGYSIPAAEHSTITSWGKENEIEAYRNLLAHYGKPGAIFAAVCDSYDLYSCLENLWGGALRHDVVNSGATVVLRPDSGDPVKVVIKCLEILADKFGTTTNSKGYKILNNVRVIQGDGVNPYSIEEILFAMKGAGFSASNVAFGMGGALLQKVDRDTQKFAYKCSSITVGGAERDVYKSPITDLGKGSKAGRLDLSYGKHGFRNEYLHPGETAVPDSALQTVYFNGELQNTTTFAEVRERSERPWL